MPRRVQFAVLLAVCLHGLLILTARYRYSYDAYTHMLFADHYRLDWWSLWDPRWYAGFAVNSYPPLAHQLVGLLGRLIGVDAAFAIVLWLVAAAFPIAVYCFSRVWVPEPAAEYAALGAAFLPSLYLSAYTFGQLPTLASTLLALFCAAALAAYLRQGDRLNGALAVMLVASLMGAHHATLMLLPWLFAAVGLSLGLNRVAAWPKLLLRLAIFGVFAAAAGLLVIWPFWRWGLQQSMQVPIDHATRHNFFADAFAAFLFFWSEYGPLALVIPFALWKIFSRPYAGLALPFLGLLLLGLGGTTPLPRILFGAGWEWLTYDRFALWATLLLLPFFGLAILHIQAKFQPILRRPFNTPFAARLICSIPTLAPLSLLAVFALLVSLYPTLLPTQPAPVNMQPVVAFLAQNDRSQWRYLTFGFGDQYANLNRLTSATTIDGSYHTARSLPELRSSGIGSIDSAYWLPNGLNALSPILKAAGKYGVRWGFVNNQKYVPVLLNSGWVQQTRLSDGVQVWENPQAALPPRAPPPPVDLLASFSWGVLPLLALAVTAGLAGLRLKPILAQQALLRLHAVAIGLLPAALGFWYYRLLTSIDYPRVYLTYDNALVFLSDALMGIAVGSWALARGFGPPAGGKERRFDPPGVRQGWFRSIRPWLLGLCTLASLSIFWSKDWQVALYLSLHLWLCFGLFLSLCDRPNTWKFAAYGFCLALVVQAFYGLDEFASQSTHILAGLKLLWPGELDPATPGASVVQLLNGVRWLRAYGTLPHPNILGTFLVALIAGPMMLYLTGPKWNTWAVLPFAAGAVLLLVTFSRGAWVGLVASALVMLIKSRWLDRRRLMALGIVGAVSLAVMAVPLRSLIFTRMGGAPTVPTEDFSIKGRTWLAGQALFVIRQHPILGVGQGSFVLDLSQRAGPGYIVEPVHNLPLLVFSELGLGGAILLAGAGLTIAKRIWVANQPIPILLGAALVGLLVTSLFDHSLWSTAPGRTLLFLMLGLSAGQVEANGSRSNGY